MAESFHQLSSEAKKYINSRFDDYRISGEDAYNHLFSDDIKDLSSEEVIQFLRQKDVSHIIPQSVQPEKAYDIENVFLEDSSLNRARGAEVVTEEEIEMALADQYDDYTLIQQEDTYYQEFLEQFEGLSNYQLLDEIVEGSLVGGMGITGYETYQAIHSGEIQLNKAPQYFVVKSGGRIAKYAVIGFSLTSSSPVIVSAGVGYIIYNKRDLLKSLWEKAFRFGTHEQTKKNVGLALQASARGISATANYSYKVITSETSKNVARTTGKVAWKSTRYISKKSYDFLTDQRTIDTAKSTAKITGKILKGSAKATSNLLSGFLKKKRG